MHARRRKDGDAVSANVDAPHIGDAAGIGDVSRVTVVAGRRLGNAVTRNRAKRRLRAAVAETALPPGFDFVVTARPEALTADYAVLCRTVAAAVTRAVGHAEGAR